jgi:hypothetical protein
MGFKDFINDELMVEGVSSEAKKFMQDFNKACAFLKDEVKTSESNEDWKVRLKYIRNLINKAIQ